MKLLDNLAERFGMNAYALGNFALAEKWFRRLEKTEPDSIRVLRNLGVILIARGDAAGAEKYLRREESLYGETYQRHRSLADLAYSTGARKEAAKRYAAALAAPEAAQAAKSERAFLETRLAICEDRARFDASRESDTRFKEGESARGRKDAEAALAFFLAAAELDPTNWPALNNAGVILLEREEGAAQALELFRKAAACARIPMIEKNIELAEKTLGGEVAKKR
jgi:Flp pilus assembly protein TadD